MKTSEIINAAIKSYRYSKPSLVDGRLREIKKAFAIGWTKKMILEARMIHLQRIHTRIDGNKHNVITHAKRVEFLTMLRECTYDPNATSSRYNCTGIDWKAFHRASSNGKGWVLIAPDEPGNNWYMEDVLLVKFLSKRFEN